MAATITAAEIRAKFPDPMTSDRNARNRFPVTHHCYCIGGACLSSIPLLTDDADFPSVERLEGVLRFLNADLAQYRSTRLAARIIRQNDSRNFEGAWATLDEALRFTLKRRRAPAA